jgi:hypothetical protein
VNMKCAFDTHNGNSRAKCQSGWQTPSFAFPFACTMGRVNEGTQHSWAYSVSYWQIMLGKVACPT